MSGDLDHCPVCQRLITDQDELGCEAPDGQRWCVGHALETLARHRQIDVQLSIDEAEIRIGEVLKGDGQSEPQVWLTGKGRRQQANNEHVEVHAFMSMEKAEAIGTDLIGQTAVLRATLEGPSEGDSDAPSDDDH